MSALIVFVNVGVALTIMRTIDSWGRKGFRWHPELLVTLAVTIVAFTSGVRHLRAGQTPTRPFRVAIVQPNIPQEDKWTADTVDMIYERLRRLTGDALLLGHLDLIIWPETALPDDVRDSVESYNVVYEAATNGVPLLVGSMDTEWQDEGKPHYFNSSFLFNTNGAIDEVYDKRHLVMFGEYIPLQRALPFVKVLTPIQDSFTPGTTSTVFRLENPRIAFSSLICFEDTVASLARDSVRNGARLLINQTNDGWFDPSSASRQHMLQCVLRCVENGVPAVRSANTGVSCAIDASGRVHDVLDDGQGNVRIQGCRAATVQVPGENMPLTFYTRRGDLFAQGAAAVGGSMFIAFLVRRRKVATSS